MKRCALVATSALMIAGLFAAGAGAEPTSEQASFSIVPSLFPDYSPQIHNYVVRCNDGPVTVESHASGGWEVAIANGPFRSGDFTDPVPLSAGRAFTVTAKSDTSVRLYRYYVRCLPSNFPTYSFTRSGPVSPQYFSADQSTSIRIDRRYAIIFNNHGVPIWWYHVPAQDTRVLPDGTVLWSNRSSSPNHWEIHRLDGTLVRTLDAVGHEANAHDLQFLGNGDYLVGSYVTQSHVDTSAYGGSSDADVLNTELQQVSSDGGLLWDWTSQDHISLAETGRFWGWVRTHPHPIYGGYDIVHWNSIEPIGESVIASFRHLDAVYKIRKTTGNIVWKLGGTTTPKSLEVRNDPHPYTFGGQHDARLLPDGTLTVFDDRTNLAGKTPRAVRYRIDQTSGTATLLQSISDPDVPSSLCCGSARRLGNGDWLIDWGQNRPIGGYKPNGERTFLLSFDGTSSYRAEPVPSGVITDQDLRRGMNAMYPTP
jgi:Arylsulfotransferase (ASST)